MRWLLGFVVGTTLVAALAADAGVACADPASKGLAVGVAVPSWAVHRRVHFLPSLTHTAAPDLRGALSQQGAPAAAEGTGQVENTDPPALYHEGGYGVQRSPHVYVVFWGSDWNEAAGAALRAQLLKMYDGLSGSSFEGILTQYFDSTGRVSSAVSVASYTDEGVTAPTSVNDQKIREEAAGAIAANGWPRELDSQFVVIPAPGATYEPGFARFCGYHGIVEEPESDREYTYTFVPYVAEEPFYSRCIAYDEGGVPDHVSSMVASHEYAESATDPGIDTWFTEEGLEIADICATRDAEVHEGSLQGAWVQGLWDDDQSECLLSDPEPPHVYAVTEEGADLQPHEVELSGVVNPEGLETHYRFEYGSTTSYGTDIPAPDASAGAGLSDVDVSETVKGLAEGMYHYRLVATNSLGTTYGKDRLAIAPGFSVKTLPEPVGSSEEHEAEGVSCVSPQTCIAVGAYWDLAVDPHALITLAEAFDDDSWSVQPTPSPAGATESSLRGVSCVSASECTAVGYYKNGSGTELTLAERWSGGEWTIQPTPNPPGTSEGELSSVSCPSASECTAVGYYAIGSGAKLTLAERWNGGEWTVQSTPNPSGVTWSQLQGLSCVTPSECIAVGHARVSSGNNQILAERWNGGEWTIQSTPSPSGATGGQLDGVSCSSTEACTAVGSQEDAGTAQTLAERWDGSEWSVQPTYSSLELSGLSSVSCSSATECVAVGSYWDIVSSSPASEVLAERWNGSGWTQVAMLGLPRSPGMWRDSILNAVSCTESTACLAVGDTTAASFGGLGYAVGFAEREFAPPTLATETASAVTYAEATVNGTLNPQGLETSYRFEYGPTTSYGASAPVLEASAGSAVGRVGVSETLEGLQPQATYHYRLVASNAAGTTYGEDETFTTAAPPPTASTSPPTISGSAVQDQTLTEAHGSWTNNPTSYAYQWQDCDGSGANCSAIAGATGQTYPLTAGDVGHTIRVQETASNARGAGGAASSATTALVQAASSGGGSGPGSGGGSGSGGSGSGSGGKTGGGGGTASLASVSTARLRGDLALIPLSCRGSAGSCTVMFTLTVVGKLRAGMLAGVSAAAGTRHRASKVKFILRTVIVGRRTVTLRDSESEVVSVALNATGRRLLGAWRVLAVKLTVSENGARPSSQIIRFKAPVRDANRRR